MRMLLKWIGVGVVVLGLVGCLVPRGRGEPPYVPDDTEVLHIRAGTRCIHPDGHEMVVGWDGVLVAEWRFVRFVEEYQALKNAHEQRLVEESTRQGRF